MYMYFTLYAIVCVYTPITAQNKNQQKNTQKTIVYKLKDKLRHIHAHL